jgi:hypothetical protein
VSIDKSGQVKINQDEVEIRILAPAAEVFKTRNDRTAFVQGDPDLCLTT